MTALQSYARPTPPATCYVAGCQLSAVIALPPARLSCCAPHYSKLLEDSAPQVRPFLLRVAEPVGAVLEVRFARQLTPAELEAPIDAGELGELGELEPARQLAGAQ